MEDRLGALLGELDDVGVGVRCRDRALATAQLSQSGLRCDLEREADAVADAEPVLLGGQVVVDDPRLGVRHRVAKRHAAAAARRQQRRPDRVTVIGDGRAEVAGGDRDTEQVKLDVRRGQLRARPHEGAGLDDRGGERTAALAREQLHVLGSHRGADALAVGLPHERDDGMVLQVASDRQVELGLDSERPQLIGGSDAREQQQLRRLVCAGAHQHLSLGADGLELVAAEHLDAGGAGAVEDDAERQRVGEDVDVAAGQRRSEVGHRRAAAAAVSLRDLEPADALLGGSVVIGVAIEAGLG